MPLVLSRLASSWAVRSLAINASGSAIDYATVALLVVALGLPTPVGTVTGLALGAAWNFTLNRNVAFADRKPRLLIYEAARYVGALSVLMTAHAFVVWYLRDRLGVPLFAAKIPADMVLLGATQPFILRHFVFPRALRETAKSRAPVAAGPVTRGRLARGGACASPYAFVSGTGPPPMPARTPVVVRPDLVPQRPILARSMARCEALNGQFCAENVVRLFLRSG